MSGNREVLREEVAALAETIRELREELASQRAATHHCGCAHAVWVYPYTYPYVAPYVQPGITWTSGTTTAGRTTTTLESLPTVNLSYTQAAAGCAGASTTYTLC
jgi:hypothetical protein